MKLPASLPSPNLDKTDIREMAFGFALMKSLRLFLLSLSWQQTLSRLLTLTETLLQVLKVKSTPSLEGHFVAFHTLYHFLSNVFFLLPQGPIMAMRTF